MSAIFIMECATCYGRGWVFASWAFCPVRATCLACLGSGKILRPALYTFTGYWIPLEDTDLDRWADDGGAP